MEAAYAAESWKRLVSFWCAAERDPDIYICQTVTILATIDYTGRIALVLMRSYTVY
jgi:hypothetical protein